LLSLSLSPEEDRVLEEMFMDCRQAGVEGRLLGAPEVLHLEPRVSPGVRMGLVLPEGVEGTVNLFAWCRAF
jgi:L-2-hydroxyglutarate oxidase LhgO